MSADLGDFSTGVISCSNASIYGNEGGVTLSNSYAVGSDAGDSHLPGVGSDVPCNYKLCLLDDFTFVTLQ